eukprot:6213995-Pleurochrysis_carterae.AAC.2
MSEVGSAWINRSRARERSAATLASSSALACWVEKGWSEGGTLRALLGGVDHHQWGAQRQCAAPKQVRSLVLSASAEGIALPYALWQTGWLLLPRKIEHLGDNDRELWSDARHFLPTSGDLGRRYHQSQNARAGHTAWSGKGCGPRPHKSCGPALDQGEQPNVYSPQRTAGYAEVEKKKERYEQVERQVPTGVAARWQETATTETFGTFGAMSSWEKEDRPR